MSVQRSVRTKPPSAHRKRNAPVPKRVRQEDMGVGQGHAETYAVDTEGIVKLVDEQYSIIRQGTAGLVEEIRSITPAEGLSADDMSKFVKLFRILSCYADLSAISVSMGITPVICRFALTMAYTASVLITQWSIINPFYITFFYITIFILEIILHYT